MLKLAKTISVLSAILGVSGMALADVPSIQSIADLKKLQGEVTEVVAAVQPATVSLTSDRTGAWGSGVVISKEGRILTAAHVVQGLQSVTVIFPDGTETVAKVLGANRSKDTAMLQIREQGQYPFVEMGDSDQLQVGSYLIALGHAGGHDPLRKPPVRFGRLVSKNVNGFFSSDCTLIGGDSGGPIFDIDGKLVGINSSIGEAKMANNHAGISALKADWKRLEAGDTWGRLSANPFADSDSPVLGVGIEGATKRGILLGKIVPGSPAQRAGVREGDILLSVAGKRVKSGSELLFELNRYRPGQSVQLELLRGSVIMEVTAKLAKRGELYQQ